MSEGFTIREVGDRLFIFFFEDPLKKDRVIQKQLWSFNKSLLVMTWCPFWVQAHGLPLSLMNEKIGTVIGEVIGDVEEVETNGDQLAWVGFLK